MKLLHGSPVRGLKELQINESFRPEGSVNIEGSGIYLSDNEDVAIYYTKSVGSVYIVEFNGSLFDSNNENQVTELFSKMFCKIDERILFSKLVQSQINSVLDSIVVVGAIPNLLKGFYLSSLQEEGFVLSEEDILIASSEYQSYMRSFSAIKSRTKTGPQITCTHYCVKDPSTLMICEEIPNESLDNK